jgi:hypothetical protein
MRIALGELSPDGRYYWDGSGWVPRYPPAHVGPVELPEAGWDSQGPQQPAGDITNVGQATENPPPAPQPLPSPTPPPAAPHTIPPSHGRRVVWRLIRMSAAGLMAAFVVGFLVSHSLDQWEQGNRKLATQAAEQRTQLAAEQQQVDALQAEVQALKQR